MFYDKSLAYIAIFYLKQIGVPRLERGEGEDFSEILIQVLGLGKISREKFFKIIEMNNKRKLSSQDFFKLLDMIEKQ